MDDIFISYSWKDKEFATRLHYALKARHRQAWVDLEDIPPTAEWRDKIKQGIEGARAFVFVLSPDSMTSQECLSEIDYAAASHKRLIPVLCRDVDTQAVPEALSRLNWISFKENDDFEKQVDILLIAVDTDLEWVDAHASLLQKATEWDRQGRGKSLLLRGEELRAAEVWQVKSADKEPKPTELMSLFILASRQKSVNVFQSLTMGIKEIIGQHSATVEVKSKEVEKAQLWVESVSQNCQINILNLRNEFIQGMKLEPGSYHIEVSAEGFETKREWIDLNSGEEKHLNINLSKTPTTAITKSDALETESKRSPSSESIIHVFISYQKNDKLIANIICNYLEERGVTCWIAPRNCPAGEKWAVIIPQAIKKSKLMILIFSSHSDKSKQVNREVTIADKYGVAIIPFRIEDVDPVNLEYYLSDPQWLDAFEQPIENHFNDLLNVIRSSIAQ